MCRYIILLLPCLLFGGSTDEMPWRFPAPERLVAIGDLHGDLMVTRTTLRLAKLIDEADHWIGGSTVLVQTGDQIDRGDDDRAIIDLFEQLRMEAEAAGGAIHILNGNHELMNAAQDFRYVTPGAFASFKDEKSADDARFVALPLAQRARAAAFAPGGPYALILAKRNTIVVVGDTVFVHGGVLPSIVKYGIGKFNSEIRAWLRGERERPEQAIGPDSPVWSRHYSLHTESEDCASMDETVQLLSTKRMVVAHTVQEYINATCDFHLWRIDVGMSSYYGGRPSFLEIVGDSTKVVSQ